MLQTGASASRFNLQSPRGVWLAGALLCFVSFATYWNSLRVPFFFDDPIAILENPSIRDLRDVAAVLSPPRNGSGVTGRPLVNLSLAINYALGGTAVGGYHFANILFHAFAGLALFGCVRRTLLRPLLKPRFGEAALSLAFLGAALWILHPLQTESVTCVIQRTELLVGVFYLLTLYCFIRATSVPSRLWPVLTVLCCFSGMATKEVMVSAPLIVLLYDRTFVTGSFAEAWRRRRPLYLGLAASWILLGLLVASVGGTRGEAAGFGVGATWWSYALKQCEAIILYLKLTAWPHPLVVFYGVDVITNPVDAWREILLLIMLVGASLYALWRKPVLGFFAMWFFVILAPSSSVVPLVSQTVSEHRMYLPIAGPLIGGTIALFVGAGRLGLIVATCAAVAMGVISARRNLDYRSDLAIWTDTVAKAPANSRARVNLGAALKAIGDTNGALAEYQAALRYDPNSPEGLNNLATTFLDAGRPAEAIEPCLAALRLRPKFAMAHNNLGTALAHTGRINEGIAHLQTALDLRPDFVEAHCNLASALVRVGQTDRAIQHGEEAVRLRPDFALAHFNLSNAFLEKKQPERAIAALEAAIRAKPDYAEALLNLGGIYYQAGDAARAIPYYQSVLRHQPAHHEAYNYLASALFQTGRTEEAIEHYRRAIHIQPTYVAGRLNLALVLSRIGRNAGAIAEYEEVLRLKPDDPTAKDGLARLRASSPAITPPR